MFSTLCTQVFVVFGQRCNKDCFVLQNVYNLVLAFELALEFVFELRLTFVFFLRGTAWIWVTGQGAEEVDFTEEATKRQLAGQRGPSHHTVSEYKKHRSQPQDRKHRSQAKTRKHKTLDRTVQYRTGAESTPKSHCQPIADCMLASERLLSVVACPMPIPCRNAI